MPPLAEIDLDRMLRDARRLQAQGALSGAEALYLALLRARPAHFDALHFLGVLRAQQGAYEEAERLLRAALAVNPGSAPALANLGLVLRRLGRFEEALASIDAALGLAPNDAQAHNSRGNALLELSRPEEALGSFEAALAQNRQLPEALNNRGSALRRLKRFEAALASYDEALALRPRHVGTLNNRGVALQDLKRAREAIESYEAALAIDPKNVEALINRGLAWLDLERPQEAALSFEQALKIDPEDADAHYNLGWCALLVGDFERGWREYGWRWRRRGAARPRLEASFPVWRGESLEGRSIVVFEEQGFGDVLLAARFLPLLCATGARVTFLVSAALHRLLCGLSQNVALVDALPPDARFDFQSALMSLPGACKALPPLPPYLRAEPQLVDKWRGRIGAQGFKIGVCWQGDPASQNDVERFAPLEHFAPLATLPGVRLISLQKRHGLDQLEALRGRIDVETLEDFDDGPDAFIDTAAVMLCLDMIVTVDTSIAHLAGALGRPTLVALKFSPDWRWGLERADCLWYPATRLFRQNPGRDWDEAFLRIAEHVSAEQKAREAFLPIPGSIGELYDKITILEIKTERIADSEKLRHVFRELALLRDLERRSPIGDEQKAMVAELKRLNESIWDSEEGLRESERDGDFGAAFIAMARNVYKANDARAALKRRLNLLNGSGVVEEKSHPAIGGRP